VPTTVKQKLLPSERQKQIRSIAKERGALRIPELARQFAVSEMTIRRDLEILETAGFIERTFGGAVLSEQAAFESSYSIRLETNMAAKKAIAGYAAGLIYDGDTIALDSSTTALALAKEVVNRDITVLSNSLDIAQVLRAGQARVILTGGYLRRLSGSFVGPLALKTLENLRIDHSFISAKGLIMTDGLLDSDLDEAEFKRAMIASAARVTAIIDSTKFEKRALAKITAFEKLDLLITDDKLSLNFEEALSEIKQKYYIVKI